MPETSSTLELATFAKHVGEDFQVSFDAESRPVKLIEATGRSHRDADPAKPVKSFSLIFRDPGASVHSYLGQGIYRFEHPDLAPLDLFLVPVGPGKQGDGICYEVIFNLLPEDS